MIDHVTLRTHRFQESRRFYLEALAPLGYRVLQDYPEATGMGLSTKADFWIVGDDPVTAAVHLAFTSADRAGVDAFYAAALKAGGRDNGPPGIRALYHPHYYGAFVHDPDGNNIEAVCHEPKG